jgi:hypothetical protein
MTAVKNSVLVFWDITLYGLVGSYQVSEKHTVPTSGTKMEGNTFLRNFGLFPYSVITTYRTSTDCTVITAVRVMG